MTKSFFNKKLDPLEESSEDKNLLQYLIIFAGVLVSQGMQLLNDGVYWDGWIYFSHLKYHNWHLLYDPFRDAGYPLQAIMMWLMALSGDITFNHRVISFLCILISAIIIYKICLETGKVSRKNSVAVALLFSAYPVFQTSLALNIVPIVISYTMFFLGAFLSLKSEKQNKEKHVLLRIGALVAFIISYVWRSFLVYYFGFLLILLITRWSKDKNVFQNTRSFFVTKLDYVLLPFAYWFVNGWLFPASGLYAADNQFLNSPVEIVVTFWKNFKSGVFGQFGEGIKQLSGHPWLWLVFILFVILGLIWGNRKNKFEISKEKAKSSVWFLLIFGGIFLFLAIFPYAMVGKIAGIIDFSSRHSLLISLPLAMILVGLIDLLFTRKRLVWRIFGWILICTVWLGLTLTTNSDYLNWQMRWIKDRSIMVHLSQSDEAKRYSVFWTDDKYPLGGESNYRFYEWSSLFKEVWGDEKRIGFEKIAIDLGYLDYHKPYYTPEYNLAEFDPKGCQAIMVITKGSISGKSIQIVGHYYYYKFFNPSKLEAFLLPVTSVEVNSYPSTLATNCK